MAARPLVATLGWQQNYPDADSIAVGMRCSGLTAGGARGRRQGGLPRRLDSTGGGGGRGCRGVAVGCRRRRALGSTPCPLRLARMSTQVCVAWSNHCEAARCSPGQYLRSSCRWTWRRDGGDHMAARVMLRAVLAALMLT